MLHLMMQEISTLHAIALLIWIHPPGVNSLAVYHVGRLLIQ